MTTPPKVWTIGALLQWTADFFTKRKIEESRLSAELLLAHALNCSRMALYTQYERVPAETHLAAFRELVKKRGEGVPVAYLVGKAWFFSLELIVSPAVLIPRPDTETLVETVISTARQTPGWESPVILDLCTGSGCIAIALAKHLPAAQVYAADLSKNALAVAEKNVRQYELAERVHLLQGDLFEPVREVQPPAKFQVIAANPPYIPTADIANLDFCVRDHEPREALDGGLDGLDFHQRIVAEAREFLLPGGMIILEIEYRQALEVQTLFAAAGYLANIRLIRDAAGNPRCVAGTYATAGSG